MNPSDDDFFTLLGIMELQELYQEWFKLEELLLANDWPEHESRIATRIWHVLEEIDNYTFLLNEENRRAWVAKERSCNGEDRMHWMKAHLPTRPLHLIGMRRLGDYSYAYVGIPR